MLPADILTSNRSERTAILFEHEAYSYAALDDMANRFAHFFLGLGLEPGDRVSFLMGNDALLVAAYFGAFRTGMIANPLNNRLTPGELAYIINHAGSRCIVVSGEFTGVLGRTLPLLRAAPEVLALRAQAAPPFPARHERELHALSAAAPALPTLAPEDGALLIYTSGTTGHPKGVLLSQHNVISGVQFVHRGFEIKPTDRTLCVMPLFHTNALMFSHLPFLLGGATVLLRRRFSASAHWKLCRELGANSFSASPTILAMLLEHEANAPARSDIRLEYVKVASAPTPVELAERFERRFGEGLLLETYGLTETTAISTMNPLRGQRKFGSIGQALTPQEVAIADDAGNRLAPGQTGEIIIRGPTVMKEYFRDPDNTRKAITDGWLHTGDVARLDEQGYFFIVGRKKEMILRGGENISPLEIEQVLAQHPAVREAAAVGLPDRIWGEVVGVCVVARQRVPEEELIEFCRQRLSQFKVPQHVAFVSELPRNAMGKIRRAAMRDAFPGVESQVGA